MAWDGQALVCENGDLLAEGERFADHPQLVIADLDLQRLAADRLRTTSFADNVHDHRDRLVRLRRIAVELPVLKPVVEDEPFSTHGLVPVVIVPL